MCGCLGKINVRSIANSPKKSKKLNSQIGGDWWWWWEIFKRKGSKIILMKPRTQMQLPFSPLQPSVVCVAAWARSMSDQLPSSPTLPFRLILAIQQQKPPSRFRDLSCMKMNYCCYQTWKKAIGSENPASGCRRDLHHVR